MDTVLHDILLGGIKKYLNGTRQTKYIVSSKSNPKKDYWNRIRQVNGEQERTKEVEEDMDNYWQLQRNQEAIRWDNLLQGKFVKDWRKVNGAYKKYQKAIRKQKEKLQKKLEKEQEK